MTDLEQVGRIEFSPDNTLESIIDKLTLIKIQYGKDKLVFKNSMFDNLTIIVYRRTATPIKTTVK